MSLYLSGFSLGGGLDADAPTGGPLGMSPPSAQTPPAGLNGARIRQVQGGCKGRKHTCIGWRGGSPVGLVVIAGSCR